MDAVNRRQVLAGGVALAGSWVAPHMTSVAIADMFPGSGPPPSCQDASFPPQLTLPAVPEQISPGVYRVLVATDPETSTCPHGTDPTATVIMKFGLLEPSGVTVEATGSNYVDLRVTGPSGRAQVYVTAVIACDGFVCHQAFISAARRLYHLAPAA